MAYYKRAKLALDGFRSFGSQILSNARSQQPTSKISPTGSSILDPTTARNQFRSPFLGGAKRFYYVDRHQVQHFRPRGPRRSFQNPRIVLIVILVGSGALIPLYFGNLETVPYTKRTHFVLLSKPMERKLGKIRFDQIKAKFKGKLLPASHPENVRVQLLASDIIKAMQKGLRQEQVWSDMGYASESARTTHEESGHNILVALKEGGAEKKGQERECQSATSRLDGLDWEILVVNERIVNAWWENCRLYGIA
ncbi:hypothetical protein PanWU01x14_084550 [Parasponia andersonii]|uniref:Uncharacterized protein n=1 Tax=Parasponia andersonii TaxID=3476 RepID=A0A2P5D9N2_PARAD|nr:hypothetical protein PanWU01x14_084550 [Parasponia andersonii]